MTDVAIDIETYPNCFTLAAMAVDRSWGKVWEISDYVNESAELLTFLNWMRNHRMVGFNNLGFDYPVIHMLMQMHRATAGQLYDKAMVIINAKTDKEKWAHQIWEPFIPQLDLYKIHHFDNKSRRTGLKQIEFAMRMDNIKDLPFPAGTRLNQQQIPVLKEYNLHDVEATVQFYHETKPMIEFRETLSNKYQRDFMNHNDTKIGKDYFTMRLEANGVTCYTRGPDGRQPRQTKRPQIPLRDAIQPDISFTQPEFQRVLDWLREQTITETKGVFKDLTATVGGLQFVFGLGGIHGSIESEVVESDEESVIIDLDVTSYYPSIAIAFGFYPLHLGATFCDVYGDLKAQRVHFTKGTPENAMLKLALNGVYGDSNNAYSIFYDPLFTMRTTLNGQLLLCLFAEWLISIDGLRLIQANTDGLTVKLPRRNLPQLEFVRQVWEGHTGLQLEEAVYSRMFIRDVNNYIAEYENGDTKRIGAYEHDLEWHKNHSALVVPKVAEQVLLHDAGIRETVTNWPDKMDFMLCAKVPRSSRLVLHSEGEDLPLERITRYYVTEHGGHLVKIMPPLAKKPDEWRRIGICSGWSVQPCNDLQDATQPINFEYYIREVEKLCLGLA